MAQNLRLFTETKHLLSILALLWHRKYCNQFNKFEISAKTRDVYCDFKPEVPSLLVRSVRSDLDEQCSCARCLSVHIDLSSRVG